MSVPLPTWIVFWSLVFCTMIMIVATFTTAIQPIIDLQEFKARAVIAQAE